MRGKDIKITIGAVVEIAGKGTTREVVHFAYCRDLDVEDGRFTSVKCANFARQILNRICGNEPGTIIEGWPEEREWRHLWHIDIKCQPTHGSRARIEADYSAMPDCPFQQRQEMMAVYGSFRAAMRAGAS